MRPVPRPLAPCVTQLHLLYATPSTMTSSSSARSLPSTAQSSHCHTTSDHQSPPPPANPSIVGKVTEVPLPSTPPNPQTLTSITASSSPSPLIHHLTPPQLRHRSCATAAPPSHCPQDSDSCDGLRHHD
jgi:hypothetical protein